MIGMDFISFLILLVIGIVVAFILHYLLKFYALPGLASFFGKIIAGWLGGWLGSPVFGYWFSGLNYHQVYIIPAILGSLALIVVVVLLLRSFGGGKTGGAPGI